MRRSLVLVLGALVFMVSTAVPAGATFKGKSGQIAYVPELSYGVSGEIWTADPDGGNATKLADVSSPSGYACAGWFSGSGSGPRWSPDGSQITFATEGDLWVMAHDGSDRTRLTNVSAERAGTPVWSPDGSKIAVVLDLVLYVVDAAGAGVTEIASTSGGWFSDFSPPSWSKDGEELAAVIEQWGAGPHDVYVVAADGSSQVNITNDGQSEHPAWSPNGREIAFTTVANLASIDAIRPDGSHRRSIADLPTADFWPQWSPNGSSLLFSSYDGWNFLILVHLVKPHGKQIVDLPSDASICDAVWSPDGKEVLFVDAIGELWTVDSRVRTEPSSLGLVGWLPSWQGTRRG